MKLRKIKIVTYRKIQKLIFWKKIRYYIQRVRIKGNEVIPTEDNEIIELPDKEMWAIYKPGQDGYEAICETKDKVNSICEILNNALKNKNNKKLRY